MAKLKLSDVPVGKSYIDSNSTFKDYSNNDITPEWCVVAHDADGEGITTLIMKNSNGIYNFPYDAKEPLNPDTDKRDYGNTSYEYSNVLQFLNSDDLSGEWYTAQHEYDQEPVYPYVNDGFSYNNHDAFLSHFHDDFKASLIPVEKMGVTRKVHLPACNEIVSSQSQVRNGTETDISFDVGTAYNVGVLDNISSSSMKRGLFRGSHNTIVPWAGIQFTQSGYYTIQANQYTYDDMSPYNQQFSVVYPVIFMDSDAPVELNTTDQKYYASWDIAPVITYTKVGTWKASAFNIVFRVTDADADTVSTIVKIDNTQIYSNPVTTLGADITVNVDATTFGNLAYGKHTITITANDGVKETVITDYFRKANAVPNVLSNISENRVFVDENTTYNGQPIEWFIAARDIDGEGITSLMMKNPIVNHCFDAKEIYNPVTARAENGYSLYSQSNILQWLNAIEGANAWYHNQHEYDYPPDYKTEDGFLHNFGITLLETMQEMEKFGTTRKVHVASIPEIVNGLEVGGDNYQLFDTEVQYTAFNKGNADYKNLTSRQYPAGLPLILVRGGRDKDIYGNPDQYPYYTITCIGFRTSSGSSSWNKNAYRRYYNSPYIVGTEDYPIYTIPAIYLHGDEVPVRYDSEADKYYLDFSVETEYQDYGRHNKGFTVGLKINCSTNIGDTTVKVYADNGTTALATLTVSEFNQFVNVNIPNSALSDLALGNHTLTLKTDTLGILSSANITFTKTADSVPTILSESIGHVSQPINTTYQVYEDDGDSIDVVIKLDGTQIQSITDAPQHSDIPLTLSVSQFSALAYGNHSIVIEATDGANTSTTELPFVKNSEPEIALNVHDLGEVIAPVSVVATYSNADGEEITITADIDGREIPV